MFTFSNCFGPFFPSEKYIVKGKRDMHKTAAKKGHASTNEFDSVFKRLPTVKAIATSVGIKAIRHRPIIKTFFREIVVTPRIHFGGFVILFLLIIALIIKNINSIIRIYFTIGLPPTEISCRPV